MSNKTLKFQPGDLVSMIISGKVVGSGISLDEQGRVVKHARVRYGNPPDARYIIIEEDRLRLIGAATRPQVTAVRVTKEGEEPVDVPFTPVEKVDGGKQWKFRDGVLTEKTALVACQNCDWTGTVEQVKGILNFEERVAPGEILPAGECPVCSALARFVESDDSDDDLEVATAV